MPQPKLLPKAWASDGLKNDIPAARSGGLAQEAATYAEGFPGITMTPISVGGKPPSGKDMNGVLHDLSAHAVYQSQGGRYRFDQAFCDTIGGYPKGAVLMADTLDKEYISLVDGNRDNPNSGGRQWAVYIDSKAACLPLTGGALSDTLELKGYNALSLRNTSSPRPYAVHLIRGNDPYIGLVTDAANIDKKWGSGNDGSVAGNYTYFFPKASGTLLVTGSVENSLTSNAAAVPLSAAMGKKLADEKADKSWVSQQAQAVRTALKNEILGGAGAAFDTLKEFQTALGDDANFAATTAGKLAEAAPSGMIAYFAGQTAPAGWLKANGVAVSRTAYARLFAAVGTTYGAGDGKTTFNLPDLRGEFLRSWDDARGIDTGRVFGSAQADEFRAHNHVTNINADIPTYGSETGDSVGTEDVSRADDRTVRATTGMRGGAETRPRNIALLACIKI
ncbi:phage tail protein [Neisseria bacilliformis]|nr:phage tail protein [Neisseria bacilliformis]DAX56483.1 MAG TPA: tail fiber protein [Caudoviricetes sp.]